MEGGIRPRPCSTIAPGCPPLFASPALQDQLPRPAPQRPTPRLYRPPQLPVPAPPRCIHPFCLASLPFSFARVQVSPVPSSQLPVLSTKGPVPRRAPHLRDTLSNITPFLSKVSPAPLLQAFLPSQGSLAFSPAPHPLPTLTPERTVRSGLPTVLVDPARQMAVTIGEASGANVRSGENSPTFPAGPVGFRPLVSGRLMMFPSRLGPGAQVRTEGHRVHSPGCQGYQGMRAQPRTPRD